MPLPKLVARLMAWLPCAAGIVVLTSCTHLAMEPCEDYEVLGVRTPGTVRIRTEHYRAMIAEPELASKRLAPYALMSAYTYRVPPHCIYPKKVPEAVTAQETTLKKEILEIGIEESHWGEREELSIPDSAVPPTFGCEDKTGLMYNVWERQQDNQTIVVVAFRGTSGDIGDWIYGNLWWFTRILPSDNQFDLARVHMQRIIYHYEADATMKGMRPPRFITTGHSLGGGIAQHMLYSFPSRVEQAIVFDPSPVTASADASTKANEVMDCSCLPQRLKDIGVNLGTEARILRVYFDYEILSIFRLPHKIFFKPLPYVQEITFNLSGSLNQVTRHSMSDLAEAIHKGSGKETAYNRGDEWIASANEKCKIKLRNDQARSCTSMHSTSPAAMCPIVD